MEKKESDFQKRLLATFKTEAKEHISTISSGLFELEKKPAAERQMEIVENIFREAHSLKGAARAVNITDVGVICQSLESVFAALKRQEIILSQKLFDTLYQTIDGIGKLTAGIERTDSDKSTASKLTEELEKALKLQDHESKVSEQELQQEHIQPHGEKPPATSEYLPPPISDTIRIPTVKLHSLLLQAEELLSAKLTAIQRATDIKGIKNTLGLLENEMAKIQTDIRYLSSIQDKDIDTENLHFRKTHTHRLLDFFDFNNTHIKTLENKLSSLLKLADNDRRIIGGIVDNLLADSKKLLMLPFSSLLEAFPRFVRDISREQGKTAELKIQGGNIEIDRRILEEMKDAFMHLVRNCIDHGIERPNVRRQKNKPPHGTITFSVLQKDSSKAEILISDDGAGIDTARVRSAAMSLGIVSQKELETLNEQESMSLIFSSGVSTSPIVTDISGRGLGLAIVREKVGKLGGAIFPDSRRDAGTTFRIILPMTLATFLGVLVCVDEHLFVLPTINVEQVVRVKTDTIKTVENRETIQVKGQTVSLARLGDVLELPGKGKKNGSPGFLTAVVLSTAERRIAFSVDKVMGEQEVLVKGLGKQLQRVRNIAGATVLGTGKVVPIINVSDLIKSAIKITVAPARPAVVTEEFELKKKSILVVEDSITARMLLKNILETAGYDVTTAVDGIDAFTILRSEDVDLVVSDVDMPRMNGFDLTAKIRGDKKLAELPVVLVTALESGKDRERGIDVGADAYIVKSSFDQSNLLEVIKRFI